MDDFWIITFVFNLINSEAGEDVGKSDTTVAMDEDSNDAPISYKESEETSDVKPEGWYPVWFYSLFEQILPKKILLLFS